MDILRRYLSRLLKIWVTYIFFFFDVLEIVAFVMFFLIPGVSFPWWVFWVFGFFIVISFGLANVMLFAELQSHIDALEDTRADIRFKNIKNLCYPVSIHSPYFSTEGKTFHDSGHLYRNGLPIGVIIGAELKVAKRSDEPGDLDWKITKVDLPHPLNLLESDKGSFQWTQTGGEPLHRIERFLYESGARYELPIEITEQDPPSFAQRLSSLGSYRVAIQYRTTRFDSESKLHSLILEGDFQEFRDDICKKWKGWGFSELAQLAECQ